MVPPSDPAYSPTPSAAPDRNRARTVPVLVSGGENSTQGYEESDPRSWFDKNGPVPDRIGRYHVLHRLGSGGMGVVFAAHDPELDRMVAIKLLRPRPDARARILREAKAAARVAHPNVIHVYETGTHHHALFLAMEFVEGCTLRKWLAQSRRSWREILSVLLQAGKGLAAAHAVGLVHRDFKPDNVLVGKTGRVWVLDFGLARASGDTGDGQSGAELSAPSSDSVLASPITASGTVMGTPAYMAPEQREGSPADPRTDQFSFCTVVWESLFRQRPFSSPDAVAMGELDSPPKDMRIPPWLVAAITRGLQGLPDDRYPSMQALLDELARRPRLRPGTWLAGAFVCAAGVASIGGYGLVREDECSTIRHRLDGVWDDDRKRAIETAYRSTGRRYAADAWRATEGALDAYSERWLSGFTEVCNVEESDRAALVSRACLLSRLQELDAMSGVLASADDHVVQQSSSIVASLTPIEECADPEELGRAPALPADRATRMRVQALRFRVAESRAQELSGRYQRGLDLAVESVAEARSLSYSPVLAESLVQLGGMQVTTHRDGAEQTLREAIFVASASGHSNAEAKAWLRLFQVVSSDPGRASQALHLVPAVEGSIIRAGGHARLSAALANDIALLAMAMGDYAAARRGMERAIELRATETPAPRAKMGFCLSNLAAIELRAGNSERALELIEDALSRVLSEVGTHHPLVGGLYNNMGVALRNLGRIEESLEAHLRALSVLESAYGPDDPRVAAALDGLGQVYDSRGETELAIQFGMRAHLTFERTLGPQHVRTANALNNLATSLETIERFGAARDGFRRSLAVYEANLGDSHPHVAIVLRNIAMLDARQGDVPRARALCARALAIREQIAGADGTPIAASLGDLASLDRLEGKPDVARTRLERALALVEHAGRPDVLAEVQLALAGVLDTLEVEHERARELDRAGRKHLGLAPNEPHAWLTSRPTG